MTHVRPTLSRRLRPSAGTVLGWLLVLLGSGLGSCRPVQAQPATLGQWSGPTSLAYRAIHAHLLPTGKVMYWQSYAKADFPQLWDPSTRTSSPAAQAGFNIFCNGGAFLADGRLLLAGGHLADNVGLATATIYDPFTNAWSRQPDMNAGRWYPTAVTLGNGDVLVVSGMVDTTVGMNLLPQVWQRATGTWRSLTTAQLLHPYYPYMFLAPDGRVFIAGPAQKSRLLGTSGTGGYDVVGNNRFGSRNWGSAVMYEPGKVLIMGGILGDFYGPTSAAAPTKTAEAIDLTSATRRWNYVAPMAFARKHHNATLLPDGTVLVTGGSRGSEDTNAPSPSPVYAAEMWNPATNTWTTLAPNAVYRGYHATALLLPDGRVLSTGGDHVAANAEVYSPPYLFKGARPTMTSAPTTVNYGQTFVVATPNAASITQVTWIPFTSVTHTNSMGQRFNRLSFTPTTGGLQVTVPASPNLAPPGYYMLFIVNSSGVPAVARTLRLNVQP